MIITLFQEDNISGTNVSLTYGPQSGLHNPTHLEGGGCTIYSGSRPAGVTTRSPR